MKPNLTLEDIGRLAGVSRSTVSRVLNQHESVRPDVRKRVTDVIDQTGYSPNVAARSLVSGKTGLVGLVIPSRVHSIFSDPYFGRLIQGISAGCNRHGISLTFFLLENESEEAALYPRIAHPGFLDGLILTATRMGDPLLARLAFDDLPVVVVGRPDIDGVSYVDVDNIGGARAAAAHLCGLGYQRIGHIGAPQESTAGFDRLNGFVEGLAAFGVALDPRLTAFGDFSEESGYEAMRSLLPHHPDAVFVASDRMALGATRAAREAGIDTPGDLGIVGFDGSDVAANAEPPLSSIRQDVYATGRRAVDILHDLTLQVPGAPFVEIQPVELEVRASTRLIGAGTPDMSPTSLNESTAQTLAGPA